MTRDDQQLLARIDERVSSMAEQLEDIKKYLEAKVVTRDECQLTRKQASPGAVLKDLTFIVAMLALVWKILQNA